ncbi:ABC-2 type transport system permease protein [Devosia lucknowensis]|uniref:ABC-2 type transport system permease protein n=1 Tax=Devosia lucknowensis TaxID=1096929 RepID=A0A1Y6EV52_9HYPH|nr:ABC transporter permease [Devosia lucknowensis]SMQ65131.1 ABC-2 type transport system permease protein [Devosia lucknowensis]
MIVAMLRVMALSLIRDRGALVMAFLLPPTIFVIFAAIFAGTSGDELRLQVALGVGEPSSLSERLVAALRADDSLRVLPETYATADQVVDEVESGRADVGLMLQGALEQTTSTPAVVYVDPGKVMAGAILAGQVQRVIGIDLPDLALARSAPTIETLVGGFTPEQSARLDAAIAQLAENGSSDAENQAGLVESRTVGPQDGSGATVTYYAGAVAILFLLFSAMQSAATLIEERHSGIIDRIAVGPAGTDVVVIGKFLFLSVQGIVQVSLIFLVAALVYDVEVISHLGIWLLTTLVAAAAAAGLGLAVAALCTTKQQAQTISTFVVLLCSAVGGSMVPRFMMPPWLQEIGWFTPNAWTIEAYHGVLWRGEGLAELLPELSWLLALGMVGTLAALAVSRLRLRL